MERFTRPAAGGESEELAREIDTVYTESRFREEVCVPSLPARCVEDA